MQVYREIVGPDCFFYPLRARADRQTIDIPRRSWSKVLHTKRPNRKMANRAPPLLATDAGPDSPRAAMSLSYVNVGAGKMVKTDRPPLAFERPRGASRTASSSPTVFLGEGPPRSVRADAPAQRAFPLSMNLASDPFLAVFTADSLAHGFNQSRFARTSSMDQTSTSTAAPSAPPRDGHSIYPWDMAAETFKAAYRIHSLKNEGVPRNDLLFREPEHAGTQLSPLRRQLSLPSLALSPPPSLATLDPAPVHLGQSPPRSLMRRNSMPSFEGLSKSPSPTEHLHHQHDPSRNPLHSEQLRRYSHTNQDDGPLTVTVRRVPREARPGVLAAASHHHLSGALSPRTYVHPPHPSSSSFSAAATAAALASAGGTCDSPSGEKELERLLQGCAVSHDDTGGTASGRESHSLSDPRAPAAFDYPCAMLDKQTPSTWQPFPFGHETFIRRVFELSAMDRLARGADTPPPVSSNGGSLGSGLATAASAHTSSVVSGAGGGVSSTLGGSGSGSSGPLGYASLAVVMDERDLAREAAAKPAELVVKIPTASPLLRRKLKGLKKDKEREKDDAPPTPSRLQTPRLSADVTSRARASKQKDHREKDSKERDRPRERERATGAAPSSTAAAHAGLHGTKASDREKEKEKEKEKESERRGKRQASARSKQSCSLPAL
jgi:hypothetical protein